MQKIQRCILDAEDINLETGSIDIYMSVSVIEHVFDKWKAISEAARVLRKGGMLIMTFDICEPKMGMSFPEWNGNALTMKEFDDLFTDNQWFEPGLAELSWNTQDIQKFLSWHRTTASHHNYVTGAAVAKRSKMIWSEPKWKDRKRSIKRISRKSISSLKYNMRNIFFMKNS